MVTIAQLIAVGTALARSIGHNPEAGPVGKCPKLSAAIPCTCGAGRQQAKALDDWQHLMADIEADNPVDILKKS